MFLNLFLTADQRVGLHSCNKGAHYSPGGTLLFFTLSPLVLAQEDLLKLFNGKNQQAVNMSRPQKSSAHNPQFCLLSRLQKTHLTKCKAGETQFLKSMEFKRQEAICVERRYAYVTDQ